MMPKARPSQRFLKVWMGLLSILLLLALWKWASLRIGKDLVLPSPERVALEASRLFLREEFRTALFSTFLRGLIAFALSVAIGSVLGFLGGLFPLFGAGLSPILTVVRATPVLALILLALLWFPADFVPIFSALLMAAPVMCANAMEGARAADPKLLEMSRLFQVPPGRVLLRLRLPASLPYLLSGAHSSLGLSWKVVVAGEVLSQPRRALGTGMQEARVLLETPEVFAWALSAILLCGLTEWAFASAVLLQRRKHGL